MRKTIYQGDPGYIFATAQKQGRLPLLRWIWPIHGDKMGLRAKKNNGANLGFEGKIYTYYEPGAGAPEMIPVGVNGNGNGFHHDPMPDYIP